MEGTILTARPWHESVFYWGARDAPDGEEWPAPTKAAVDRVIDRFAPLELNELLDIVYFHTGPVRNARRGERLDLLAARDDQPERTRRPLRPPPRPANGRRRRQRDSWSLQVPPRRMSLRSAATITSPLSPATIEVSVQRIPRSRRARSTPQHHGLRAVSRAGRRGAKRRGRRGYRGELPLCGAARPGSASRRGTAVADMSPTTAAGRAARGEARGVAAAFRPCEQRGRA
jgi:hypothetical protein